MVTNSTTLHFKSCDWKIQSTTTKIQENPSLNHEIFIKNKKWHLRYHKSSLKQMVNDVYGIIVISKIIPIWMRSMVYCEHVENQLLMEPNN
jgi:hypothetical protein